jgi:8-oxo-dGTP pyrophosphatase MutT (NUDIX family)
VNATLVRQAGAIVFRTDDQGLRFLIVRAKQNPADWIFPKGHIEPGESAAAAALREARERLG